MKAVILQGVLFFCLLYIGCVQSGGDPTYLDFDNLPDTNFSCVGKVIGGYYADLETNCQMFHVCTIGQLDEPMDIRFLCLNGTVFDQETRVCERVDEVDCSKSERFYHLNLELYGNTAPPLLEEPDNTEPPIISTSTTTTTPRPTTLRTTRTTYYTTPQPSPIASTTHSTPKVITSNHFPVHSGPDIRFNPEEINIRLTPGSPPIIKSSSGIKTPSVSYQQQTYNGGDSRITVTTHTPLYKDNSHERTSPKSVLSSTTQKPKSLVSYGLTHSNNKPHYQPTFDYTSYQQTENSDVDYHTDLPSSEYYDHDSGYGSLMSYQSSNKKPLTQRFSVSSTTKRNENNNHPTFISSTSYPLIKTHQPTIIKYNYQRTEKSPSAQLPLPIFPTLPPLTFSSPAPFSLTRHFESKRSNDQQQRPRIIVSASASVSDASGRRLNYSLGTIGTSHILGKAPHSYDEYKEDDVGLDPFYHDVPKVKNLRRKRSTTKTEEIQALQEELENTAAEVFDSKENQTEPSVNTTPWTVPEYVDDNYEPLTYNHTEEQKENNTESKFTTQPGNVEYEYYYEYIDDNYEPSTYQKSNSSNTTTSVPDLITTELQNKETTLEANTVTEPFQETTTTQESLTTAEHVTTQVQSDSTFSYDIDSSTTITTTLEPTTLTTQETTTANHDLSKTTYYQDETTTTDYPKTTTDSFETTTELSNSTPAASTTSEPTTEPIPLTTTDYPETTKSVDPTTTILPTEMLDALSVPSQTTTRNKYSFKTREPSYKKNSITRPTPKHRFSSPSIHMSPSVLKIGTKLVELESVKPDDPKVRNINPDSVHFTTNLYELPITEAPILKSADPTESRINKKGSNLSTTPLTKTLTAQRRFSYDNTKTFNCLGKQMNKFYEDPRDCRLFHYCTPGYTSTQVLDMKFVCDFGTYFDSAKLICTRFKPQRCKTLLKQV